MDGKEQGNGNDSFLATREVVEGAEVVLLDSCKGNLDGDARVNLVSTFEDLRHFLDLFSLGDLRLSGLHELYLSLASWLYPLENELELLFQFLEVFFDCLALLELQVSKKLDDSALSLLLLLELGCELLVLLVVLHEYVVGLTIHFGVLFHLFVLLVNQALQLVASKILGLREGLLVVIL